MGRPRGAAIPSRPNVADRGNGCGTLESTTYRPERNIRKGSVGRPPLRCHVRRQRAGCTGTLAPRGIATPIVSNTALPPSGESNVCCAKESRCLLGAPYNSSSEFRVLCNAGSSVFGAICGCCACSISCLPPSIAILIDCPSFSSSANGRSRCCSSRSITPIWRCSANC